MDEDKDKDEDVQDEINEDDINDVAEDIITEFMTGDIIEVFSDAAIAIGERDLRARSRAEAKELSEAKRELDMEDEPIKSDPVFMASSKKQERNESEPDEGPVKPKPIKSDRKKIIVAPPDQEILPSVFKKFMEVQTSVGRYPKDPTLIDRIHAEIPKQYKSVKEQSN